MFKIIFLALLLGACGHPLPDACEQALKVQPSTIESRYNADKICGQHPKGQ